MRCFVAVAVVMFYRVAFAAPANWTDITLTNGALYPNGSREYHFGADIYGENGAHAWMHSFLFGHMEDDNLYLKHEDFSHESMEPTYNWWALALYADIVSEATFDSLNHVEDTYINDPNAPLVGGTQVENPSDFYMTFKVSEVLKDSSGYSEGQSWYGWVHVSVDDDLRMTLLGSDINLTGGAVTVGVTPEPTSALLLLVGGALLALRRRRGSTRGGLSRYRYRRHNGFDPGENDE